MIATNVVNVFFHKHILVLSMEKKHLMNTIMQEC